MNAATIATLVGSVASLFLAIFAMVAVMQTKRAQQDVALRAAKEDGAMAERVKTIAACVDALESRATDTEEKHNELRNSVTGIEGKIDTLVSKVDQFYAFLDRREKARG